MHNITVVTTACEMQPSAYLNAKVFPNEVFLFGIPGQPGDISGNRDVYGLPGLALKMD